MAFLRFGVFSGYCTSHLQKQRLLEATKTARARGYKLVITRGNGPQVGNLLIQQEVGSKIIPPQPLDIIGAMTQGQMGYMLQQTLMNYLEQNGLDVPVVAILTQVLVNARADFQNLSKPVGPFYTKQKAERLRRKKGYAIKKLNLAEESPIGGLYLPLIQ